MINDSIKIIEATVKAAMPEEVAEIIRRYENDERAGVKALLKRLKNKQNKAIAEQNRLTEMYKYEQSCHERGEERIAGVDEVGRGPLAGPVVAAAVILPKGWKPEGINDSKKLSEKLRNTLYEQIMEHALCVSVSTVTPEDIDRINIYQASKKAMTEAVSSLEIPPDHVLIDAMTIDLDVSQTKIIKGDQKSVSIAAASIIAKVTRDEYMKKLHERYPFYGFSTNMGYGTAEHLQGLREHGPINEHRKTFAPVQALIG
ncbi:ribonuclease HII [Fictibacillus iocasae]|uniref:Ribonuclease HII n=1 Tax=Fictibacillus iocasae TaxID=2715437 RepID=A0ABW2NSH2_9BACL